MEVELVKVEPFAKLQNHVGTPATVETSDESEFAS
jgi:hypothetical protein